MTLLDNALGGLAPGFPLVVTGPTGAGRTVLCLQLAEQLTRRQERVVFLTGEPVRLLLRQAVSMDLDLATPLRDGRLNLLELNADVARTGRVHGGEALVRAIQEAGPGAGLLVIDPLTALTCEITDEVILRALVRAIFDASADAEQIAVVTVEATALQASPMLEQILREACGAFIELRRDEAGSHVLNVTKSRTADPVRGAVRFRVGSGGMTPVVSRGEAAEQLTPALTPSVALGRARVQWSDVSDVAPGEGFAAERTPEGDRDPDPPRTPAERTPEGAADASAATGARVASEPRASGCAGSRSEAADPKPELAARPGPRPRILVVEDDRLTRDLVSESLAERYEVITAEDGFEAVSAVLAHQPDLVVLDLILPRVDGFEVLRTLRRSGQLQPILVLSGKLARAADRVRALVLGATDLMRKPVGSFELIRKVETLLHLSPARQPRCDVADAEKLLGGGSTRTLEDRPFRDRLERACRFGEKFDMPSALIAVETPSTDALDRFAGTATKELRAEDAMLIVAKRRALLLLVAMELSVIPKVLERLQAGLNGQRQTSMQGFRWKAIEASPEWKERDWEPLFADLGPWPVSASAEADRSS